MLHHVYRRTSALSEMVHVGEAGLHLCHKRKSFRGQPNAILVWASAATTVGKSSPETSFGCVLSWSYNLRAAHMRWLRHLQGYDKTLGMMRPWGCWDHGEQTRRRCSLTPRGLCQTISSRLTYKLILSYKIMPCGSCAFWLNNPWVSAHLWKCLRRCWRPLPSFKEMSYMASYSRVGLVQLLPLFCIK